MLPDGRRDPGRVPAHWQHLQSQNAWLPAIRHARKTFIFLTATCLNVAGAPARQTYNLRIPESVETGCECSLYVHDITVWNELLIDKSITRFISTVVLVVSWVFFFSPFLLICARFPTPSLHPCSHRPSEPLSSYFFLLS